jgi:hypothetical protein
MRTKKVKIDEDEYTVGALTLEQVEEFIAPIEQISDTATKARAYELVCFGLNNPNRNKNEADVPPWTKERVYKELDLVTFMKLQSEILEISGLKVTGIEPGETQPVMELTSEKSAVVS